MRDVTIDLCKWFEDRDVSDLGAVVILVNCLSCRRTYWRGSPSQDGQVLSVVTVMSGFILMQIKSVLADMNRQKVN